MQPKALCLSLSLQPCGYARITHLFSEVESLSTQVDSIKLRTSGSVLQHTDSLMVISPINR